MTDGLPIGLLEEAVIKDCSEAIRVLAYCMCLTVQRLALTARARLKKPTLVAVELPTGEACF